MKYVFAVDGSTVKFLGHTSDNATTTMQSTYPAKELRTNQTPVLDYDSTLGVRYVYVTNPSESPGIGYEWKLAKTNGTWGFVKVSRPLTPEERLEQIEEKQHEIDLAWKEGEAVDVDDERFASGVWYVCIQSHVCSYVLYPDKAVEYWTEKGSEIEPASAPAGDDQTAML